MRTHGEIRYFMYFLFCYGFFLILEGLGVKQEDFYLQLKTHKKIASVKYNKHLEKVFENKVSGVFLLTGNISVIKRYVDLYLSNGLFVFIHLEKIGGLQSDREGLEYIANYIKPTGVISTKSSTLRMAKKLGLLTVQRLFLVDSDALRKGLETCEEFRPDAIELMPGLLPKMIERVKKETNIPLITGGLISTPEEMKEPIHKGAIAVSIGNPTLWGVDMNEEKRGEQTCHKFC